MNHQNVNTVRAVYEDLAAEYAERSFHELRHKPIDRHLLDVFAAHVEGVVCDLGCGPGQVARYLRDQGIQVLGVDLSAAMVAEARRLNPDIPFLEANMYQLPVATESWGGIVAFYSLIHIPRYEIPKVLRELKRVLLPGGLLMVSFHLGQQTIRSERWWNRPAQMDYTHFLLAEMQAYLMKAGFAIEGYLQRPPYVTPWFWESPSYRGFVVARKRGPRRG